LAQVTVKIQGGDKFQDVLDQIGQKLGKATTLNVGFLEGSYEPDTGELIPPIAYRDEFGDPAYRVPPRPFMRGTVAQYSDRWGRDILQFLKDNRYDAELALMMLGDEIRDQIKLSILDFQDPPNAASTIKKKGFNDPLIDTGGMYDAVDWEVL
jgi:hypothetical protein